MTTCEWRDVMFSKLYSAKKNLLKSLVCGESFTTSSVDDKYSSPVYIVLNLLILFTGFGRQYQDHARLTPSKQPNSHHVPHPRPHGSTSRPEYGQRRAPPPLPLNSRQNDGGNLSTSVGNISLGRTRSQDSADSVFFLSASHV